MKVFNGKVSSLAPINLLFKQKAFKDHHQPTLKYYPQILPLTNNLRQFSTEFNKQLNNNLVTEDDKNVWPREHVLNFYNFINPRFTSAKYFESQELEMTQLIQRIKQEQQDDSNKPLPMEIFKGLVERPCFVLADEILKMISQDKYGIIPNTEEMKRVALLFNVMRANYSTIIIKAFIQEWFNYHETCSPPIAYGMNINGKDITEQCQISNLNTIIENQILYLIESKIPTRETLMCLVTLIMAKIQRRDMKKEVSKLIMKFIEVYPIVKSRYTTTVSTNDTNKEIDSYWNEVLGKVYTEDEFDWYLDLETDLPIHLGGMFNIFTEFIQIYNISNPNTEKIRKIFKDEQCKSPKNPYIPLLNVLTTYDMKMADECLRILSESQSFSRINDLKRIELKNAIFTNEKPKQERIKDLKLSPVLLIKVKDKVQDLKNTDLETSLYLEQVEYYSRILTNSELLVIKFLNEFKQKRYEKALEIYKVLYKSFQEYTEPMTFFKVTNLAGKVMAELGQYEDCISVIGKLKDKYGNENGEWEKLLQLYKREISKRNSK